MVIFFVATLVSAQHVQNELMSPGSGYYNSAAPSVTAAFTNTPVVLDGFLDEDCWRRSQPANDFWQYFPTDSALAALQTEIYYAFDNRNLYVGAKCYSIGDNYVVESLKRDFRAFGNDNITLVFDTFKDGTNAFVFGATPQGVLREALISNGGQDRQDFSESWDNAWEGEVKIYPGYWIAEFAIPFKTLRYNEGSTDWGFNCYRFDFQGNERSTWIRIPQNQLIMSLAFMGNLHFEKPLPKAGKNFVLIPYLSGDVSRDFEENQDWQSNGNFGGDAKVAITSGLNLDLTVNPDFSQVEVDRQVTNLTRFEIRFPERRQFFLENADLFGRFGFEDANPFFSRRIGIAVDTATDENIQNPILFGARLSGKLNDNWRLGLLNLLTQEDKQNDLPAFNYTVAALQRKVFARSNVGFIFVNKESVSDLKSETYDDFNRVLGIDYNLATADNSWTGKAFYHHAITADESLSNKYSHGFDLGYRNRNFELRWAHQLVGEGFDAQVGFVQRNDFFSVRPSAQLFFYPKNPKLVQHGPMLNTDVLFTPGFGRSDHKLELVWQFQFLNQSRLQLKATNEYIYLFEPFDPTKQDVHELPQNTDYNFTYFGIEYSTDPGKPVSVRLEPNGGQFFNGQRYGLQGTFTVRFQPYGNISLNYTFNHIELDSPYTPVNLYLIGPRIEFTFTRSVFLTTFIQYNSQADNININARFQWRFAPVSDFFLVYTDNYLPENFSVKNRALVAKLTYWLNL